MSGAYRIVAARPEHVEALAAIEVAAAALFPPEDLPEAVRSTPTSLEDFRAAQAAGMLWVALDSRGAPVGFALVELVDAVPHLEEIDVHPDHARRGVGAGLLDEVCRWAEAAGHAALTLTTFRHLAWNAPFYARQGFRALAPEEVPPGLQAILRDEARRGLDPAKRVAMRRALREP